MDVGKDCSGRGLQRRGGGFDTKRQAERALRELLSKVDGSTRWEPPWAVVLGQRGFFDRFTVSMSRFSMVLGLEDRDVFDVRYGIPPQDRGPGSRSRRSRH